MMHGQQNIKFKQKMWKRCIATSIRYWKNEVINHLIVSHEEIFINFYTFMTTSALRTVAPTK
jgi:hypothetical protein